MNYARDTFPYLSRCAPSRSSAMLSSSSALSKVGSSFTDFRILISVVFYGLDKPSMTLACLRLSMLGMFK